MKGWNRKYRLFSMIIAAVCLAFVIQGCGGDLQEWVDGINDLLTQEGILQNCLKMPTFDCLFGVGCRG